MCITPNRPYLWAIQDRNLLVFRPDCKMWKCKDCAQANKKAWARRVYQGIEHYQSEGETFFFITLTSHENLKTFAGTVAVWPKVWSKLYARMKRVNPHLHYAMLPEQHADGRLHMHALINERFDYVDMNHPGRWLKDNCRDCGGGYIADIQPLNSAQHGAYYVTKYVGKSLGVQEWPENFRRVRVSNHWPALKDSDEFDRLTLEWHVETDEMRLLRSLEDWQAAGYRIIGLRTGELLDIKI